MTYKEALGSKWPETAHMASPFSHAVKRLSGPDFRILCFVQGFLHVPHLLKVSNKVLYEQQKGLTGQGT